MIHYRESAWVTSDIQSIDGFTSLDTIIAKSQFDQLSETQIQAILSQLCTLLGTFAG